MNYEKNSTIKSSFGLMNSEKTLKNDENTEKEYKLSGYYGIGHLLSGYIINCSSKSDCVILRYQTFVYLFFTCDRPLFVYFFACENFSLIRITKHCLRKTESSVIICQKLLRMLKIMESQNRNIYIELYP